MALFHYNRATFHYFWNARLFYRFPSLSLFQLPKKKMKSFSGLHLNCLMGIIIFKQMVHNNKYSKIHVSYVPRPLLRIYIQNVFVLPIISHYEHKKATQKTKPKKKIMARVNRKMYFDIYESRLVWFSPEEWIMSVLFLKMLFGTHHMHSSKDLCVLMRGFHITNITHLLTRSAMHHSTCD